MLVKIFFCYAHQNEDMRNQLEKHLRIMKRQGMITTWYDGRIDAGVEWEQEIYEHLNEAHIILLLISPDFMNSDYCYGVEMKRALERHDKGEAIVIPLLLRSVHWVDAPFKCLQALPSDGKFVTQWRRRDDAFTDIARGIRNVIKAFPKISSVDTIKTSQDKTNKTIYCSNCNSVVSLPMFCLKCGLPAVQICFQCNKKNSLDRETCQKCEAPLALVCNHCKIQNDFNAEFCRNCGFRLQLICYECGERNLPEKEVCQKCNSALILTCNHCNQKNALEAEICSRCGMPLFQICMKCTALNEMSDYICWRCYETLDIK